MNRNRKTAVGLAVAAVLVAAGVAVAAPALAGNGPRPGDAGRPSVAGHMMDRPGHGRQDGTCLMTPDPPGGDLTSQQESALATIAEQHKLAHDLYAALADQYGAAIFDRIAAAEARQLAAVRTLLDR